MANSSSAPWEQLFPPPSDAAGAVTLHFRLVRKRGEPLLLLPRTSDQAITALALYPAQTAKARLARWLLRFGLRMAPGFVAETIEVRTSLDSPFLKFLGTAAGTKSLPHLALLAGNPRAPGRRFVILLFNDAGAPAALVKAGVGDAASGLIARELNFLKSQPASLLHAPGVRAECAAGNINAFALDYVNGTTPRTDDTTPVASLLYAWLQPERKVRFAELAVADRLAAAAASDPRWAATAAALRDAHFAPAIHHGDFAPWNVRADAAGQWHVLDWERGEASGPPAWDWFHYLIQNEILVRHTPTEALSRRLDALLASVEFRSYAARAGMEGCQRELLVAYLLYCARVIKQADGLPAVEALLDRVISDR